MGPLGPPGSTFKQYSICLPNLVRRTADASFLMIDTAQSDICLLESCPGVPHFFIPSITKVSTNWIFLILGARS